MPSWVVDEDIWEKAKKAFVKSYGREPSKARDWMIVTTIYKKMGGRVKSEETFKEGLMDEIKKWLKKFVTNPIKASILALMIYKILKSK